MCAFAMCGCLLICVLVFTVFRIVCNVFFVLFRFLYIYSYLFSLYYCKDYCHRVTTQLQLVVVVVVTIIIIIQRENALEMMRYFVASFLKSRDSHNPSDFFLLPRIVTLHKVVLSHSLE